MAGKGMIAFIVLCFTCALTAGAGLGDEAKMSDRYIEGEAAPVKMVEAKPDPRLFFGDGTQVTVSTETLALGVLLLGIFALALVVLPGLLGGGEDAAATSYTAPSGSTYAQDPYAKRSARSASNILNAMESAAKKFL